MLSKYTSPKGGRLIKYSIQLTTVQLGRKPDQKHKYSQGRSPKEGLEGNHALFIKAIGYVSIVR